MCLVRGFTISSEDVNEDNNTESTNNVFTTTTVGFLILSSTLGIIIGDVLWLEALQLLGAKHVIVIDSLKPFVAAILGKVSLDEVLKGPAWGGMVLTVIGVGVVSWEEKRITSSATTRKEDTNNTDANNNNDGNEGSTIIAQTESTARIMIEFDNEEEEENKANISVLDNNIIIEDGNSNDINITTKETRPSIVQTVANNNTVEQQRFNMTCSRERSVYRRGYTCAIFNVLADSLGSLLTKIHGVGMTTWSINLIRFGFAGIILVCISFGMRIHHQHYFLQSKDATKNKDDVNDNDHDNNDATVQTPPQPQWYELPTLSRIGWVQITTGVGLVTFLCPALSNFALFQIALGLAVSLGSITPLYALFLDWPFKGKRPTMRGCIGVMLAIVGVVILCIWGT